METTNSGKVIPPSLVAVNTVFQIVILYLLALLVIFSYIPFDIQYAIFDQAGNFFLSPAVIEYAWLNPPVEEGGKMIAGVDWPRINLEIYLVTLTAAILCISKKNKY